MSGMILKECKETKYLGHFITNDLSDDRDILRQRRKLYAQANTLIRKFNFCSVPVKISLFKAYCTPLYTAHLWRHYKKGSLQKMTVAYNDCMRLLLGAPRCCSASQMFVEINVPTCPAVLRNLMYRFMCRLTDSVNIIIETLSNPAKSSVRLTSKLWSHWRSSLYVQS